MRPAHWLVGGALLALGAYPSLAQDPPPLPTPAGPEPGAGAGADAPPGVQVLTQGPIHEAFASPVLFDPKPGPIIPKTPPAAINETPPDQKPEGANVQWIPGYWAWDDERNDFVWVSGVWRDIPPGRQWVPGYWQPADNGVRWVPGYWGPADQGAAPQYLPEPPASPEAGPNSPPPAPDATWSPGSWVWQENQYSWQPGFWVQPQQNWMWTPSSYSWTPNGYLYNQGYWDYPLANRGVPFAPAYFGNGVANQPGFAYSPTTALLGSALLTSLFVRPNYGSYYFGDYYAANNFQRGIYPAYSFHNSRYGYDPIYAYAASRNVNNPRWSQDLHDVYSYRRDHPEARPARTFAEQRSLAARPAVGGSGVAALAANNLALARPLNQLGQGENALRLQGVDAGRRQEIARQSAPGPPVPRGSPPQRVRGRQGPPRRERGPSPPGGGPLAHRRRGPPRGEPGRRPIHASAGRPGPPPDRPRSRPPRRRRRPDPPRARPFHPPPGPASGRRPARGRGRGRGRKEEVNRVPWE